MRIIQLIDSLAAGGAERMAVNYANALSDKIAFSGLVVTRAEGPLKHQLKMGLPYLFLEKKQVLDLKALWRLQQFVKMNEVHFVHAHGSSFFLAILLKCLVPKIKIVWHDHYGNSEFLRKRKLIVLRSCSFFFEVILTVNTKLENWAREKLYCKKVLFLSNFVSFEANSDTTTVLRGNDGKRIVCLANLRAQKNHSLLLEVAKKMKVSHPEWTFHLIGKDFEDGYSHLIRSTIVIDSLSDTVFLYGSKEDVGTILQQAEIGILTSSSEGLPVALLEYGYFGKAVVATNVGEVGAVVENGLNGLLCESNNVLEFYTQLSLLVGAASLRKALGVTLQKNIQTHYTEGAVIVTYLEFLTT